MTHGESWPPLPGDAMGLNFWPLGGNVFLLDYRNFDYSAAQSGSRFGGMHPMDSRFDGDFTPLFTSNELYLSNKSVINGVANLIIYPPYGVTNEAYDLLFRTNPLPPDSWHFVLHTLPGQTNLTVSNAVGPEGFYALGKADSSQGTNFWLAFPAMFHLNYLNNLELLISSAESATGTVTIPYQSNGPVLSVSGSGESNVNGTYILTNEIVDFASYGLDNGGASNAYANGSLVVFFDEGLGWFLADSSTFTILYVGFGVVANDPNLNDVLWTDFSNSQNEPGMTNYCAEGPLVQPFTVAASNVARVTIPIYIMAFDPNAVEQGHGINVAASAPVSVYALDYYPAASAAFTVYPTALLGTNYRVMSRAAFDTTDGGYSEFAIVATESNTTVRITPSPAADFSGIMGTGTFSNILEQGQTYLMRSSNAVDDVTGTLVTSDRPIAVFAGASSAYVPDANTQTANPLMQEQIPVEDWGTNVLALSFAGRSNGDTYRVLACQDGTVVTVTGTILTSTNETSPPWTVTTSNETVTFMTNSGEFFDIGVDGPVQFQSTKPIQVAQFANGTDFDALPRGEGDPCEVLLAPTDHYLQTNIIFTLGTNVGDFDENYINVIVPQLAVSSVLFDGSDIPATNFGRIGTSGYYGAQLSLTNSGTHKLTGPQPIGIQAYGWAPQDAYNYLGGIVK